jgi:hypothetical protein
MLDHKVESKTSDQFCPEGMWEGVMLVIGCGGEGLSIPTQAPHKSVGGSVVNERGWAVVLLGSTGPTTPHRIIGHTIGP